ncbi:MAG: anaerobic ribonucleoside-triphosphate reductase [Bacilli bacterium]
MNDICEEQVLSDLVVVKRSGQRVSFNGTKIAIAIKKAFDNVDVDISLKKVNKVYEDVLCYIKNNYATRKTINVEDIQDIIETKLKENKFYDVYQAFSDYRIKRAASRKAFSIKQQHKFVRAIERIINENKSVIGKPNDILLDFGKTISCEYTKAYVLDNKFVRAHDDGSIYIHNLDYFNLGNLSSTHLKFDNVINNNFPLDLIQMAINAKSEIDGEITLSKFDYILVPELISKFKSELKNAIEAYLNIEGFCEYVDVSKIEELIDKENTLNINIGVFDSILLNKRVRELIVLAYNASYKKTIEWLSAGIKQLLLHLNNNFQENKKYSISLGTNDSYEGNLINSCYVKQLLEVDYLKNLTTIFKIRKNNNIELYNKIVETIASGKNVALSFIESSYNDDAENEVEYFSNGRRIFENELYDSRSSIGRMIVASVSVNMGRLGFEYKNKNLKDFYLEFDGMLELAKNVLLSIFENMGNKYKENYRFVFNNNILDDDKLENGQKIRKILKKGALNIELVGLFECVINLEEDLEKQKELLLKILKFANEKVSKFIDESRLNFIISETSKSRPLKKLMDLDKAIYGIKKGVSDKPNYSRIDRLFNYKDDINNDFKYIGKYQKMLSGGCLIEIELPKNISCNKISDMINLAIDSDIGFLKMMVKR